MEDLELFNYRNLFPLNRVASFMLTLMYLCPFPFSRISLLYLLKPLYSDKEASAMLNCLTRSGYLYEEYGYYALSSKTLTSLDIYDKSPDHKRRKISIEALPVYELKSFIVASKLVKNIIPVIQDNRHWPKNENERSDLIRRMVKQIQNNSVPLVKGYNTAIYRITQEETKYLREYELNSLYLAKLYARLNASVIKAKTDLREADNYERIYKEIKQVKNALERITPLCQMLTYKEGLKVLTLSTLERNSMYVEHITNSSITIGVMNSAANSIKTTQLRKKLDYAITFAATLGLEASIVIYTGARYKAILEKRIRQLKTPFTLPVIKVTVIPERLPSRTVYLKELLS